MLKTFNRVGTILILKFMETKELELEEGLQVIELEERLEMVQLSALETDADSFRCDGSK